MVVAPTLDRHLHPRILQSAGVGGGGSGVVQWAAERKPYGTREDKKAGGDASTFAKASTSAKATVDEPKGKEAAARILLRQGYGGLKAGMRPPHKDRKVPVPRAKFSSGPRQP